MDELTPKAKIVVLDDEKSIRYSFETFLVNDGYEVACAADFTSGVDLIASFKPDIIFSDIILGNDDGLDVLKQVRDFNLTVPVIMITGQPSIDTAAEAVRLGAYDYMVKPIVKDSLLRVCRNALKNKQLIDEKERIRAEKDRYRHHLQAFFANVDDPIISVDNSRKIIACNDAAFRIHCANSPGQSYDEVLVENRSLTPLNGTSLRESSNPFLRACLATIENVLTSQAAIKNENTSFIDAKGHQCVISINCSPLQGRGGEIIGAALVVKDLTRIHYLEKQLKETSDFRRVIGNCYKMGKVFKLVRALAATDATVLITGESGTGKSLVAKEIHELSERSSNNMVTVRCSALVEHLLESELFGHVKGAFTGAINNKVGRFEMCNKGSIFLDEIGEISPALQLKLLSVIQDREYERVGDSRPVSVDTRIIAATNRHLKEEVESGKFREDLYYRLNVVEIKMPPLRERHGDVPLLVDHFIHKFKKKYRKPIQFISADVMEIFTSYPWPGNVRELEHAIEHGFVLSREEIIDISHIPPEIKRYHFQHNMGVGQEFMTESEEKQELVSALERTDWNKAKAARLLGISRPTLYRKLEKFQMDQG